MKTRNRRIEPSTPLILKVCLIALGLLLTGGREAIAQKFLGALSGEADSRPGYILLLQQRSNGYSVTDSIRLLGVEQRIMFHVTDDFLFMAFRSQLLRDSVWVGRYRITNSRLVFEQQITLSPEKVDCLDRCDFLITDAPVVFRCSGSRAVMTIDLDSMTVRGITLRGTR